MILPDPEGAGLQTSQGFAGYIFKNFSGKEETM